MSFPTGHLPALALALGMFTDPLPGVPQQGRRHEGAAATAELRQGQAPVDKKSILSLVRLDTRAGERWSVLCDETPVPELLGALARKAGLALQGIDLVPLGARLSAQLERRSLDQVLDCVLGSQGLRHEISDGALRLLPATNDAAELMRMAADAWHTVEAEGSPHAALQAKLALGHLAEVRGELENAYRIYADLSAEGAGEESAEGMYRAGRVLQKLGHWAEAAQHFRTLTSLEDVPGLQSKARLELARSSIELGNPQSALHLLNFLDSHYETEDPAELAERRLVRAQAFNATDEYVDALRTLEAGEVVAADRGQARSIAILAQAFQGLGFEVEAARAWLIYARDEPDAQKAASAFQHAAELSLEGGDELGALFVCREAVRSGADAGLGTLAHEARVRLGLDEQEVPTTIQERLELAEDLLSRDELDKAAPLLEGVYLARGALSEPDQARVIAAWSRVLLVRSGLDSAIEVLSRARDELEDEDAARSLDLAAAALFEDQGRFDEAAEAYRGNY